MEKLKGKKIVVTGGAGFIGSHLVGELINAGAHVLVIDILVAPSSYFEKQNLHHKAQIALIDIAQKETVEEVMTRFNPEYIFHLAAEAIVAKSYDDPVRTFQTNVMGTVSVLEAARKCKVKGVIVASSDKAYGKTKTAYTEDSPLQGDHPYDVSKSCTDLIAQTYYKTYGLPVVISRFGNVYGEGDLHLDRIVPGIAEAVIKNSTLQLRSNGEYVRDYVYVKDVAKGYIFLLTHIDKTKGQAYNIASEDSYSVLDLIKKAEKILNKKINYKILNTAKNEIPYQHLDCTKVKKLGWKQTTSLETGIKNTVEWYKEYFK